MAIITGDDLQVLDAALEQARADALATMANDAVEAFLEPLEVPNPIPKRMRQATLRFALMLASATPPSAGAGAVVSESLGSYTYRLARPTALDAALAIPPEIARELLPWAPHRGKVYDVDTAPSRSAWPVDWWQRDLDNIDDDAAVPLP